MGYLPKLKRFVVDMEVIECRKEPSTASAFFSFFVERKATK